MRVIVTFTQTTTYEVVSLDLPDVADGTNPMEIPQETLSAAVDQQMPEIGGWNTSRHFLSVESEE